MEQFHTAIGNLEQRAMKRVKKAVTIDTPPDRIHINETFYVVGSILFLKEIKGLFLMQKRYTCLFVKFVCCQSAIRATCVTSVWRRISARDFARKTCWGPPTLYLQNYLPTKEVAKLRAFGIPATKLYEFKHIKFVFDYIMHF